MPAARYDAPARRIVARRRGRDAAAGRRARRTDLSDQPRTSGVLLHVTSLPGRFGCGDLGPEAERFLDLLAAAGQGLWQVLPLGPTSMADSPYGALSTFAGNPLLVSPERLAEDGLLAAHDLAAAPAHDTARADFTAARATRAKLLQRAFERLEARAVPAFAEDLAAWAEAPEQATWLDDWTLFAALRTRLERAPWPAWPEELRRRRADALAAARRELAADLRFHRFVQYAFHRQWARLRARAERHGVRLFGDLPIYLAGDAAETWARPDLFELDEEGRPTRVAGVPPDYFSADGQLWGNPLYRWERARAEGYAWWIERLRAQLRWFHLVRLDHFRGFAGYWEVAAGAATAREGRWVDGPGRELFDALGAALGELPLVAEDLGEITDDVVALRRALGLPGMRVLQFGFGDGTSDHRAHRLEPETVVYTGTHDNDTTAGWFATAPEAERRRALDYLGCAEDEVPWALVRQAWTSVAEVALAPAQDLLGLGGEARMNRPGIAGGNWTWRLRPGAFDDALVARLRRLTEVGERLAAPEPAAVDAPQPPLEPAAPPS
jgi:4-alpha-glucanotransferase